MADVSIRDLRNHGGDVVDRAERGETIIITRSGRPVAELRALPRPATSPAALLAKWRTLPSVQPEAMRKDTDTFIDPGL